MNETIINMSFTFKDIIIILLCIIIFVFIGYYYGVRDGNLKLNIR